MNYNVFGETLSLTQSINLQSQFSVHDGWPHSWVKFTGSR